MRVEEQAPNSAGHPMPTLETATTCAKYTSVYSEAVFRAGGQRLQPEPPQRSVDAVKRRLTLNVRWKSSYLVRSESCLNDMSRRSWNAWLSGNAFFRFRIVSGCTSPFLPTLKK